MADDKKIKVKPHLGINQVVRDHVAQALQDVMDDAKNTGVNLRKGKESMKWLASQAKKIRINSKEFILSQDERKYRNQSQLGIGYMYAFSYDPKWKKKLPYYDRFPVIFIFNIDKTGFLGLNLHYLQPVLRARLLQELYSVETRTRNNNRRKLQLSWEVIKAFSQFPLAKPCVKRYLYPHIRSKLIQVPYEEWPLVAFLPIADFEKKSQNEVWAASREKAKINGRVR